MHLAKEVVFSLTSNMREDYGMHVAAAIGVCWYETVAVNKRLLHAWKMRGPPPGMLSDGASVLAQADHQPFNHEFEADENSPLVKTFRQMNVFPKYCSVGDTRHVVDGRDSNRVGKHVYTRANTKALGFTVATFRFVKAFLRRFFLPHCDHIFDVSSHNHTLKPLPNQRHSLLQKKKDHGIKFCF